MVVPFTAGGATDNIARTIAAAMEKSLGQSVSVENVSGLGGNLGAERVARANPDGHTLLLHHIGMSTAPALYRNLRFKPMDDFVPIGRVADLPMAVIARNDFPPKDFKELLTYVKTNKDTVSYGSTGLGSPSYLCGLLLMSRIGSELTTVTFRSTFPAISALVKKEVDLSCEQTSYIASQITIGSVKTYGVTTPVQIPSLPDLRPIPNQGGQGVDVAIWHGIFAPKGTPKNVQDKLVAALQSALKDPAVKQRLNDLHAEPVATSKATPEALAEQLRNEIAKWTPLIQQAGKFAD